jgi:hypothetical protein
MSAILVLAFALSISKPTLGQQELVDKQGLDSDIYLPFIVKNYPPRIAFTSEQPYYYDIFVINSNGSNLVQLTNNPDDDFEHSWSPDGKTVLLTS